MLTIVIPALNAAASLGACLAALDGADEILAVDGGSTDNSAGIAERAGARVIAAPRGRGTQLRA
ncbi:MAG: glycosyltransferase, partial [Sphingomonas sp.]|uniref:glycosyltransferase n=1 Tax=Sphingomonas sp. TaxID=28214 RepID=UPI00179F5344